MRSLSAGLQRAAESRKTGVHPILNQYAVSRQRLMQE